MSSEDITSAEMDSFVKSENVGNKQKSDFSLASTSRDSSEMSRITTIPMQEVGTSTIEPCPSVVSRRVSGSKSERKIGHRRVGEGGEITYKRIHSSQIMGSIQLGIQHTVGSLASKPKRDLLMNDFWEIESINFPPDGSSITPAHHYSEFRFKVYAPIAFRYFRDLFGIAPDDFLMSMCAAPLRELSNPGASGSIFYLTDDDEFIIKTVQHKEGEFLQKLLPGYYMNLSQNPRTLLPKFFGLYCFQCNSKNVRLVAMNNLLPSDVKMHLKYDLKGSTFGRKASKAERSKASPVYKDLDFIEHHPNGIFLEADKYNALTKTIQRDCMVLESFQIMDYSLLVGIHNLDLARKERKEERIKNARAKLQRTEEVSMEDAPEADQGIAQIERDRATSGIALSRSRSMTRPRLVAHSTAMESIQAELDETVEDDDDIPSGGIPARSEHDEHLLLYIGIIDILQSYRLKKKLEHTFKSIIYDGDTVSVCRPSFYAQRFQSFMSKTVFKKTPTFPLKHSPSKRRTSFVGNSHPVRSTPTRITYTAGPSNAGVGSIVGASSTAANTGGASSAGGGAGPSGGGRSLASTGLTLNMSSVSISKDRYRTIPSGSSTPPPAFDDISEEGSISATTVVRQNSENSDTISPRNEQENNTTGSQEQFVTTATYVVGEVVR